MESQEKKKIYISIPIKGLPLNKQREKADAIAAKLSRDGWKVVNPFNIYAGENPTYWDHIFADLRALEDCDAIYMCKGWRESLGCNLEMDFICNRIMFRDKFYHVYYEADDK